MIGATLRFFSSQDSSQFANIITKWGPGGKPFFVFFDPTPRNFKESFIPFSIVCKTTRQKIPQFFDKMSQFLPGRELLGSIYWFFSIDQLVIIELLFLQWTPSLPNPNIRIPQTPKTWFDRDNNLPNRSNQWANYLVEFWGQTTRGWRGGRAHFSAKNGQYALKAGFLMTNG